MQGTRVHPQNPWTGTIELWPSQTKRHRRSDRTRRRSEGNPSPQSTQDQTQHQHQDIANRWRNQVIQSRFRQTRRRSRDLPIVSLWLRKTGHPPRRRPKSSPGNPAWWRRHGERGTVVRSWNLELLLDRGLSFISGLTSFPVPASLPCFGCARTQTSPIPCQLPLTWAENHARWLVETGHVNKITHADWLHRIPPLVLLKGGSYAPFTDIKTEITHHGD